ncbi:hypothetical protein JHN63_45880 [Streptomyces sp. MBT65]|uniref:hypothetical protein n=1 Tax=Streptomyces sp. MBT65 TaxID=1488395 RepID=UPI00190C7B95|nr:hypothetical protein [Streptomyces sp. MBT65]MBK3580982.1 hypothetical protein [Streptomyces sp. MBT65]
MDNEDPDEDDEFGFDDEDDDGLPVLIDCDGCGKVMEPGLFDGDDPLLSVVPDPTAVCPEAPERNGTRMVMVCSSACLGAVHQRFRPPPSERNGGRSPSPERCGSTRTNSSRRSGCRRWAEEVRVIAATSEQRVTPEYGECAYAP